MEKYHQRRLNNQGIVFENSAKNERRKHPRYKTNKKISPISEVALVEEIDISKSGITNQLKTLKKEGTQK